MCLSIPARITAINNTSATVEVFGELRDVFLSDRAVAVGDWVLLYGGVALARISAESALETIELLKQMKGDK